MRKSLSVVTVMWLIGALARAEQPPVPGESTPAKLLERAIAAHKENRQDLLVSCFTSDGKVAAEVEWLMTELASKLIPSGEAKYGKDAFWPALGPCAAIIRMLSRPLPYSLLLEKGTVAIEGDRATYTGETQEDTRNKSKETIRLKRVDGRWFLDSPLLKDLDEAQRSKAALQQYVTSLQTSIEKSSQSADFAAAIMEPNAKLKEALNSQRPAQPPAAATSANRAKAGLGTVPSPGAPSLYTFDEIRAQAAATAAIRDQYPETDTQTLTYRGWKAEQTTNGPVTIILSFAVGTPTVTKEEEKDGVVTTATKQQTMQVKMNEYGVVKSVTQGSLSSSRSRKTAIPTINQ